MLAGVCIGWHTYDRFRSQVEDSRRHWNDAFGTDVSFTATEALVAVAVLGGAFGGGYVYATSALGLPRTVAGGAAYGGGCWIVSEAVYRRASDQRGAWAFDPLPTAAAFLTYGAAVAWITERHAPPGRIA